MDYEMKLHWFSSSKFESSEQFVFYSGEDEQVENVVSLYAFSCRKDGDGYVFYAPKDLNCGQFCVDSTKVTYASGEQDRIEAQGWYIVRRYAEICQLSANERYFRSLKIIPTPHFYLRFEEYLDDVRRIHEAVEKVSSDLESLANTYEVSYSSDHAYRAGKDDVFRVFRHASVGYNDSYISRFLKPSATLQHEMAYTCHFEIDDDVREEMKYTAEDAKHALLSNYDKAEHLATLLFELYGRIELKRGECQREYERYVWFWGSKIEKLSEFRICVKDTIEQYSPKSKTFERRVLGEFKWDDWLQKYATSPDNLRTIVAEYNKQKKSGAYNSPMVSFLLCRS